MSIRVSQRGVNFIKQKEGLRTSAYRDSVNVPTIGYGYAVQSSQDARRFEQLTGVRWQGLNTRITEAQAEDLLKATLSKFEKGVNNLGIKFQHQGQFDAVVSLGYNIGLGALTNSTMVKRAKAGDFKGAADALTWFNKGTIGGRKQVITGLVNRRREEASMFLRGPSNVGQSDFRNPHNNETFSDTGFGAENVLTTPLHQDEILQQASLPITKLKGAVGGIGESAVRQEPK